MSEVRTESIWEKHNLFISAGGSLSCILKWVNSPDTQITKQKSCWDYVSPRDLGLSAGVWELGQQPLMIPVVPFVLYYLEMEAIRIKTRVKWKNTGTEDLCISAMF